MSGRGRWATRIGWVLAASGPVAIAGVWWPLVMDYPVIAISLFVGLLGVAAFVGEDDEVGKRWRDRVMGLVDRAVGRWISRFDRRYSEFILSSLRFIDLRGLATISFYTPELDEVFVDVSLEFRAPNQVLGGLLSDTAMIGTDRHRIGDFLDHPQPAILAVVGAPGSGKTTLLRHTAREICRGRRGRKRRVPILLYLRDHVGAIVATPKVALHELVRGTLGRYCGDEPAGWFEQRLRDGDCVVLLDGLDEVARQEDRRSVADWVERQIGDYPNNDYVITSRPDGYRTASIHGATVLQVRSFTAEQVNAFVRGWYLAVERRSTGTKGEDVRLCAEVAGDELLGRLNHAPGLYELTVNPLLLTMIAIVHRYRGALPGSRADLYGEICQVMLWRRQEAKNLPMELDGDKKEALLRQLAFRMMQRRVRDLPRGDIVAEIRPPLRRMSRQVTPENFLDDVGSDGLLIERESGLYSFAHHTFQEYLAAAHIREKGLVKVLVESVEDVWWRETTLLYAARSDVDPIVQACLSSARVAALSLAFDCAEQNRELAPEIKDHLEWLLGFVYAPDTDPERRRLMAGVLITRQLRPLIPTANGGRVCARPISTDIYRLYRQDTQCPPPDCPEEKSGHDKDGPITGVRCSDAISFVCWVNNVTESETAYRLPSRTEINDSAVQRALVASTRDMSLLSTWLGPSGADGHPELWLTDDAPNPYMIDSATLAHHVCHDLKRSPSIAGRLLMLRSLTTVRDLDRVFARHLARAHAHALDLARDLDSARARAIDLDRTLDRALDRALDLSQVLDLDRALPVDHASNPASNRALVRALDALDLDHALVFAFERAFGPDHAADGVVALNRALALDRVFAFDRAFAFDHASDPNPVFASGTGHALSAALACVPRPYQNSAAHWVTEFSTAFVRAAGVTGSSYVVAPDTLADKVRIAGKKFLESINRRGGAVAFPWACRVVNNLEQNSLPIFNRQRSLTADTAAAVRLAALCLAGEVDAYGKRQLGDTFREIAAGVTLLDLRANGQMRSTETIILATS